MIQINKTKVFGWEAAIRGMRNPLNSWHLSDSYYGCADRPCKGCEFEERCVGAYRDSHYRIGAIDLALAKSLAKGGAVHAKYRRMINVTCDITTHHAWWAEFDTAKVGTVRNSCSKMHKIHVKEFERVDFSHEGIWEVSVDHHEIIERFDMYIKTLEWLRQMFNKTQEKRYWRAIIEMLPMGFNIKATVQLNYEVLTMMYRDRKNHKLDEWREFCKWIESLPYSELITG